MNLSALQKQFGLNGQVVFDEVNGLTRTKIATPHATATIFLQGAHLTAWQPHGFERVIFVSRKSEYAPGKPIRGGIPIVFPWFAGDPKQDRIDGHPGPSHGFARIQDWTLANTAARGDHLQLVFTLGPTAMSRSMGFDHFLLSLSFLVGRRLSMTLVIKNESATPLHFEQAFHTYFHVADIHECSVGGLAGAGFIDKTDANQPKPASHAPITFTERLDRIYTDTSAPCIIRDAAGRRTVNVKKRYSNSTVVWNPGGPLPDVDEWDWHNMLALETANVAANAITLAPGAFAIMQQFVSVAHTG